MKFFRKSGLKTAATVSSVFIEQVCLQFLFSFMLLSSTLSQALLSIMKLFLPGNTGVI